MKTNHPARAPGIGINRLRRLIAHPDYIKFKNWEKLVLVLQIVHGADGRRFALLDGFTWPTGNAALLTSSRLIMEKTNRSADIRSIPGTPFLVDSGMSSRDMHRFLQLVLGNLGYPWPVVREVNATITSKPRMA